MPNGNAPRRIIGPQLPFIGPRLPTPAPKVGVLNIIPSRQPAPAPRPTAQPSQAGNLSTLGGVIFGELSNIGGAPEARRIAQVALNRAARMNVPVENVVSVSQEFNAFGGKQFQIFFDPNKDAPSRQKANLVNQILEEIRRGQITGDPEGEVFFVHDAKGNLITRKGSGTFRTSKVTQRPTGKVGVLDILKKEPEKPKEEPKKKPSLLERLPGVPFVPAEKISVKNVLEFGKEAARDFAKNILFRPGLTIGEKLGIPKPVIDPEKDLGKIGKFLLGPDEIQAFGPYGQEFLEGFGVRSETAKNLGLPTGLLIGALDIFTGGESKIITKIAPKLAKLTKIDDIIRALDDIPAFKQMDDAAKLKLSQLISVETNPAVISKGLETGVKVMRELAEQTPKVTRAIPKIAPRERGFITSVKEATPQIKVSGQYIPRATDPLAIRARNLVKSDINAAENLAKAGTDDSSVATASELIKHYGETKQYDKAAEIASDIAEKLTEQGRSIQAASILGKTTPEGQLRFAAKEIQKFNEGVEKTKGGLLGLRKKVPDLTAEQAEDILTETKRIQNMPDGDAKAIAFHNLQDKIFNLVPSPNYRKLINLWKAGLLTGIKTSGFNTFSNLWHGVSEIVKDIPAVAVDKAASLFTGERKLALTARGIKGIGEGFKKGVRYMKTGFDERNIAAKLDYKKVNYGNSKFAKGLQRYEETIFHLMGAEDQPFYYGAKSRSLYSQAIAESKNQKIVGGEVQKFVDNFVKNPSDDALKHAVNDAEVSVFQNRTLLGDVARGIQKIPGGEVVVPFGRTPSAVANQLINYSPIGVVKTIAQNVGKGRFDQRMFSQGIGRGITGTGAMYLGTKLFGNDLISLGLHETERERKQCELEGRKENAFKTPNGKWRSVAVLGPMGFTLIMGGYYQQAMKDTGSHTEALTQATFGAAKSLTEQTFLRGLNQFTAAINNPEGYGLSTISNLIGSTVPTIVSDVARVIDPLERRARPKEVGILGRLKSRVPGVRETLEPRINVLGRPIERAGNAIETMIDPSRPSRIRSSEVIEELRRLAESGNWATPTEFADEKSFNVLAPEQRTILQERAGFILESKLEKLIKHPGYQKLPDSEKSKTIKSFTNKARLVSRAEMVEIITEGLQGDEMRAKLSELKEGGFLTKSVFEKWGELFR